MDIADCFPIFSGIALLPNVLRYKFVSARYFIALHTV